MTRQRGPSSSDRRRSPRLVAVRRARSPGEGQSACRSACTSTAVQRQRLGIRSRLTCSEGFEPIAPRGKNAGVSIQGLKQ